MEEALRLFEQAPPSSDHADALLDYASIFLLFAEGRVQASVARRWTGRWRSPKRPAPRR